VVEAIHRTTRLPLDVHLMITNPERYVGAYAQAGATYISVHQETCPNLHAVLQDIRRHGCQPAVVLNPATPFSSLEPILPDVAMVLVMSVNPGFGGQEFIHTALEKLAVASRVKRERRLDFLIEVDGGVKAQNVAEVSAAGAEVFVIGTGIFATPDYAATIGDIHRLIGRQAAA
jgi:ribulose-phosphate 3-epimerase